MAVATALAVTLACSNEPEDYSSKIAAQRALKDEVFASSSPESPVPADKKASLVPLAYFPIDEMYAVPAKQEPAAERTRLQVPTSTGKIRVVSEFMRKGDWFYWHNDKGMILEVISRNKESGENYSMTISDIKKDVVNEKAFDMIGFKISEIPEGQNCGVKMEDK